MVTVVYQQCRSQKRTGGARPASSPAMQSPKSKEYRASAEECDRMAAAASDREAQIKFQQMARGFREMEIKAVLLERP